MIFRSRCRNPNNTFIPEPLSLLTESRNSPYIAKNTLDKTQSKQLGPRRRKGLTGGELRPVLAGGPRGEPGAPAPHPWGAVSGPDAAPGGPSPCGGGAQTATGGCRPCSPPWRDETRCGGVGGCGWTRWRSRRGRAALVWHETRFGDL
jgi:hypothetical protein